MAEGLRIIRDAVPLCSELFRRDIGVEARQSFAVFEGVLRDHRLLGQAENLCHRAVCECSVPDAGQSLRKNDLVQAGIVHERFRFDCFRALRKPY